MSNIFKFIDRIPLFLLIMITVFFAIVPLNATPHLVEKVNMLFDGVLTKPIDIFDLFMHGTPAVLLVIRVIRIVVKRLKTV